MSQTNYTTTPSQRNQIQEFIQTELSKRGYHAKIDSLEEVEGRRQNHIEFRTDDFQTSPVIFKNVWIQSFSSSIRGSEEDSEKEITRIWVQVSLGWETFEGGTNGTKLFDVTCNVVEGMGVYGFKID